MKIDRAGIGIFIKNTEVERISLKNDRGIQVDLLSVGATIEKFLVPNLYGQIDNIVLSYQDPLDYVKNTDCLGSVLGRTAGRISNSRFCIGGKWYFCEPNEGRHLLHGGKSGFHLKNWKTTSFQRENAIGVRFSLSSFDGEGGYPGEVSIEVTYMLDNQNVLSMELEGKTSQPTILNLANHSYFNLSGNKKNTIFDHQLQICASQFAPVDVEGCPMGLLAGVDGTAFDFRQRKKIESGICANETQIKRRGGYDHPLLLKRQDHAQIHLIHDKTKRHLSIWTDQESVVLYTANHLGHMGVCFETQALPDGINHKGFPFQLVTPDKLYVSKTHYKIEF